MIFRPLGATGINCSIIGLGTGRLASVSGGISRSGAGALLGVAEDLGINLIDTADSYAQGECEKRIGVALQGRRGKFIVTTKAGYCFSALGGGLRLIKPLAKRVLKYFKSGKNLASSVRSNVARQEFSSEAIRGCLEASLRRLQTDYVDIFLLHSPPAAVMADERLFELLRQFQKEGKLRHFGVSSPDATVLESALKINGLAVVQTPVNPAQPNHLSLLPKLQAAKIGVVANQIFLSGKLLPRGKNAEEKEFSDLKTKLASLAAKKRISLNRLLIEHALAQPGVVSVLTGTTKLEHLKQNVADALAPAVLSAGEMP